MPHYLFISVLMFLGRKGWPTEGSVMRHLKEGEL
jgi:hypothetical protein